MLIIYSPPCHLRCPRLSFFRWKEIKVFDENIPRFSPYKWTSLGTKRFKVQMRVSENLGMFSSKTLISFRLKKERREHLGWHGGKLSAKVFFKVNYSFKFWITANMSDIVPRKKRLANGIFWIRACREGEAMQVLRVSNR